MTATRKTTKATREVHAQDGHARRGRRDCPDCRATELLCTAVAILLDEKYPFPVLEAMRRLKICQGSAERKIADAALELAHGDRTEVGLGNAIALLEEGVVAKRDLILARGNPPRKNSKPKGSSR